MDLRSITREVLKTYTPEGQMEFAILAGIDNFLSRIKDIAGDESYTYVQAKAYLKAKLEDICQKEEFIAKMKADQAKRTTEVAVKPPVAPAAPEVTKPALTLVKPTEEPKKE